MYDQEIENILSHRILYKFVIKHIYSIMQSYRILDKYFDKQSLQSLDLLPSKSKLKLVLEDHNLILLIRYLENLNKIDMDSLFRTLLLTAHLLRIRKEKIRGIIPFDCQMLGKVKEWVKCRTYQKQFLEKVIKYVIVLMNNTPIQEQLQVLTVNLVSVYQIIEYKNENIAKYAKIYYSLVEEVLLSLWNTIYNHFIDFQILQNNVFDQFYQRYTLFCKYLRKIPKVKNVHLKNIEITQEINRKIQRKHQQNINISQKREQVLDIQFVPLEDRFLKISKLVNQFEQDDF